MGNKKLIVLTIGLISIKNAFAYIDPGTGSAIAGSLWPLLVAFLSAVGAFMAKFFWKPIKNSFSKLRKKGK